MVMATLNDGWFVVMVNDGSVNLWPISWVIANGERWFSACFASFVDVAGQLTSSYHRNFRNLGHWSSCCDRKTWGHAKTSWCRYFHRWLVHWGPLTLIDVERFSKLHHWCASLAGSLMIEYVAISCGLIHHVTCDIILWCLFWALLWGHTLIR